jgi:hypothetical protein
MSLSRNRFRTAFVVAIGALASAGSASAQRFSATSPDIHPGRKIAAAQVFNGMGCSGNNISPALEWHGAPVKTKSYAITAYDPDAPTGSGWWHWVVYDIPANVTKLPAGAGDGSKHLLPQGAVQGNTDFGIAGYGGPCPPAGDKPHHYHFTVFALDTDKLDIPASATAAYVGFNLHAHTLAKAEIVALYGR